MANLSIRDLPDEIHQALKEQAHSNNRSLEAEVRSRLTYSVIASVEGGLGTMLHERFGGLLDDDFQFERDCETSKAIDL